MKIKLSLLLASVSLFVTAQTEFITTWKTDNPGVSTDNQITIPTLPGETYDYTIDWGDGNSDVGVAGDITHTYNSPGTYQVSITGDFPTIYFNGNFLGEGDSQKIVAIDQWGSNSWTSMRNAFDGCLNLDMRATDLPNFSNLTSLSSMFSNCSSLIGNSSMNEWDLSNVRDLSFLFANTNLFNQDIGNWDVSNVRTLIGTFTEAKSFNQDISSWDTSNVDNMNGLFSGASAFNQEIGNWNVEKVTEMGTLFANATSFNGDISDWNVRNVDYFEAMFFNAVSFNQDISDWNLDLATNLASMFAGASSFNQDISTWNLSNVTDINSMFFRTEKFNQNISTWDVSKVTNMIGVFSNATAFNQDIGSWDVSNVATMEVMFRGATEFNQDLGQWNVQNVTDMSSMFLGAGLSVENYDQTISGWANLSNLQSGVNLDAGNSQYCASVEARQSIIDNYGWTIIDSGPNSKCFFITTWKTDNPGISDDNQITLPIFGGPYFVDWGDGTIEQNLFGSSLHTYSSPGTYIVSVSGTPNFIRFNEGDDDVFESDAPKLLEINQWGNILWSTMSSAFSNCRNMDVVAEDVPDLSNVSTMFSMFFRCDSLVGNDSFNLWDVSSVENLIQTFEGCTFFNSNISNWDTSNVTSMQSMFSAAKSFNQNISAWNVSNVESMWAMFSGATDFNQNIGGWNVENVNNMRAMFQESSFNQDISGWDVSGVSEMGFMFNLTNEFNQDISNWDVSNVTNMEAMFSSSEAFNQDISGWDVSSVQDMRIMFNLAKAFNQDIANWDVSSVRDMQRMFFRNTVFDQDLGDWDIGNVTRMEDMFFNTGLSLENYDKTLLAWANLPSLQSNVDFNAGDSQYCEAVDARQFIIDTYGWAISDGGESVLCNQDNDADGIFDYKDACLDSAPGATVNENGCDIIANDAIQVYVKTPSCVGSADGAIEIIMDSTGYLLDITVEGEATSNQFDNINSETGLKIENLQTGTYTITISIPKILFERTYGVTVNGIDAISGKRQELDTKSKAVTYKVSGSFSYAISVNDGPESFYTFNTTDTNEIVIDSLNGHNTVRISGKNDCQGKIEDSFFMGSDIVLYPTITNGLVTIENTSLSASLVVYDLSGSIILVKKISEGSNSIDLTGKGSGVYPVSITSGGSRKTFKIVKK